MAAVLACGPHASLSHRSAAALWGLLHYAGSRVHVTVPRNDRKSIQGVALHHSRCVHPEDRATTNGIPVTCVARTLLDFAETARPAQLERSIENAERMRLLDMAALTRLLERSRGRRGLGRLKKRGRGVWSGGPRDPFRAGTPVPGLL
jgi:predicted transcriptional regulator of viral defense system